MTHCMVNGGSSHNNPFNNLQCLYFMYQGVVNGVVLITPHSVIFNPNVSDPLVMDRGRDCYYIKTPMSAITSAALYKDIAAMAIHDPLKSGR